MAPRALSDDSSVSNRYDLSPLSDGDVLAGTRRLVGASNQLFADLLAHLAEVETRGIHRTKACASLYTYCIYELQFSEDAAYRRVTAARLVKAFPALFDAVAHGELHLTGLLMIGPHLTASNQHEVLARAKHRTKKELAKLVRELDPLPDVPARIAPLGPAAPPRTHLRNPSWAEYVASMVPVRDLKPGERPREWIDEPTIASALEQAASHVAPARVDAAAIGPQRHGIQFTASQEYVDLLERAKALLSHTGGTSLEELHLRAMQCLVAQLEKKRYGAPRRDRKVVAEDEEVETPARSTSSRAMVRDDRLERDEGTRAKREPLQRDEDTSHEMRSAHVSPDPQAGAPEMHEGTAATDLRAPALEGISCERTAEQDRTRNIPARIRRRVFERDGAQCTFVDESGNRCREVDRLEIHHLKPFGRDGQHHADNLSLRCQAHNALAAEQDFGRGRILEKRDGARHESLRSHDL